MQIKVKEIFEKYIKDYKSKDYKSSDFILIIFSILGSSFFIYQLLHTRTELSTGNSQSVSVKIGEIEYFSNDVRKRREENVGWEEIRNLGPVIQGESVFTGDNSMTRIKLKNQNPMTINANSLVVFSYNDNNLVLDLKLGNLVLKLDKGSEILIKHNDKVLKIESNKSGELFLKENAQKEIQIKSSVSDLKISYDNKVHEIKNAEEFNINKTDQISISKFPIILLEPQMNANIIFAPQLKTKFKWGLVDEKNISLDYELQIASTSDFKRKIQKISINVDEEQYFLELAKGTYYWRLYDVTKNKIASTINNFKIKDEAVIELLTPKNKLEKNTLKNKPLPILFSWYDVAKESQYRLQVSQTSQFENLLVDQVVSHTSYGHEGLMAGEYYWRVRAEKSNFDSKPLWSQIGFFKITDHNDEDMKQIEKKNELLVDSLQVVKPLPSLVPSSVALSKNEILAPQIVNIQDKNIEVFAKSEVANPVNYHIAWIDNNKKSEIRSFYRVHLFSKDKKDFDYYKITNSKSIDFIFPPNVTYKVDVALSSNTGELQSPISEVKSFRIHSKFVLTPPELQSPLNNSMIVTLLNQLNPIILIWKKPPEANKYEIEIALDLDFKNIITKNIIDKNSFSFQSKSGQAKYFWRVRALLDSEKSNWSAINAFQTK